MTCDGCKTDTACVPETDNTGLIRMLCIKCMQPIPASPATPPPPDPDLIAAVAAVEMLVREFGKTMSHGYSSTSQQIALSTARNLLAKHGRST
jgi:hypothetical protein